MLYFRRDCLKPRREVAILESDSFAWLMRLVALGYSWTSKQLVKHRAALVTSWQPFAISVLRCRKWQDPGCSISPAAGSWCLVVVWSLWLDRKDSFDCWVVVQSHVRWVNADGNEAFRAPSRDWAFSPSVRKKPGSKASGRLVAFLGCEQREGICNSQVGLGLKDAW